MSEKPRVSNEKLEGYLYDVFINADSEDILNEIIYMKMTYQRDVIEEEYIENQKECE